MKINKINLYITYLIFFFHISQAQNRNENNILISNISDSLFGEQINCKEYKSSNDSFYLKECFYNNGRKALSLSRINETANGIVLQFYPNGQLAYVSNYAMGIEVGNYFEFYENGNVKCSGQYSNDINFKADSYPDTISIDTTFIEISYSIILLHNKKVGIWECWNENGKEGVIKRYQNGILIEERKIKK